MKIIMVGMVAFLLSVNIQAQKKYKVRSKTNITTVKDSDGNKQVIQTKEVEEVQSIEFKDADSKNLNKDIKETPVNVTATKKLRKRGN
jgi:cytoskeletal protein RodZ